MKLEKLKKNNSNYPTTLRHSLGYLPTILLKEIIEDKILDKKDLEKEVKFPKSFSFQTTCLYIDISHFFSNNYNANNKEENNMNNANNNNNNKKKQSKKKQSNDLDEIISPEFYYFCINRYYEKLISIITNHGGDVIFQGNGIYAIWPPEKIESDSNISNTDIIFDENINSEKKLMLSLKAIQCAVEIKKNSIMEIKQGCTFISTIGCSIGECKFIIFQGMNLKYDYIVIGDALKNSCDCCQKDETGGQIIIGAKLINIVNEYYKLKEFYVDGIKYCSVLEPKSKESQIKNNKATVNLIKNNFSLEQIALNNHKISKFNHEVIYNIFQRNIFDEKWLKEIKSVTLLFLRMKMNQKDLDDPNKLQELFILLQEIILKNGGNIHKLAFDYKGILIVICFGLSCISSGYNEIKGVLASIELNNKLKQANVYPFIGITSGDLFCGLCGTVGNRREYSVIGSAFLNALTAVEKAEIMYGDKKSGNDNILMDENTMLMVDSKIPCKFWKKVTSDLGFELNLFVPIKLSTIIHTHSEDNLFPLIGSHLISVDNDAEYEINEDFKKEDYIIYFEENILKEFVETLNDYSEKKLKTKIISISGPVGCGKTMLLQKSLKTFFQMNPKLREILCNSNYGDDVPFVFSSNLIFTVGNDILLENDIKEYRGLQLVLKDIFNILYSDDFYRKDTINLINKNDCGKYVGIFQKIFEIPELINNVDDIEELKQESSFHKHMLININSFIYDLFNQYKQFLLAIYKEKLSQYNLDIPLIIIIEDFNLCDDCTQDFIFYYLKQEHNPFLIITAYSFNLFPCYNFLTKREKDLFYDYENESIVKKFRLSPYHTEEKIANFCILILNELRGIKIDSVSPSLVKFLLDKTFKGIPQFIQQLVLSLYDNDFIIVTKSQNKELIEDERFKKMIFYNDFTELSIPDIIQKKLGEIIDNYLDKLEIYILKIAAIIGDIFDLTKLKQAIRIDNSANASMSIFKDNCDYFLYEKLYILESKNIIEVMYDLDIKNKYVVCKFSIPFLREILYQRTPSEYRNQMHYIIGKLVKVSVMSKSHQKLRYMSDFMELGMLEKHLKYGQVSIHDNFLNGKLSTTQLNNDNYLNINNLKTLIIRQICAKIKSIKINDDKDNMIKAGYIYKKSDGKLTWENRYFVLTTNRVLYFYNEVDYKERNKSPLGVFYLQNLFNVKLLTDGSVGGKKNIISLIVNEWFKKGEVMKSRTYYLSVEDREESFKWAITFNILKIKAFYENYCFSFGYVNFPLYSTNKNEFSFKQKKIKIKLPKNNVFQDIFKSRQAIKRMSIFSPYLSLGRVENRLTTVEFENYMNKQLLIHIKFLIKHSIAIFIGNIQIGLSKETHEYEDSKLFFKFNEHYDFVNPFFLKNKIHKEERDSKNVRRAIEVLALKYKEEKNNINLYSSNKNDYTEKQLDYFNKYYKNHFFHQEKINFTKKKTLSNLQDVQTNKLVLNGRITKDPPPEYLFFRNTEEPQIDKEDYLKYIEYTDNDGRLKEQYRRMDSGSISKDSSSSITKKRKTKIEFMINKRESMFSNSDSKNGEQNAPIFDFLNKKNTERKKKLLYTELRGSKVLSDVSSSGIGSSEEEKGGNSDNDSNKILLSDIIKSESNESGSDEKDDKNEKNKKKIKNKKDKSRNKSKSKKKSKSYNKNSKKNLVSNKRVLRSSLKKRHQNNNNEKEEEKEEKKEEKKEKEKKEKKEKKGKKNSIIIKDNNKKENKKEKNKNFDIKKIENKKFENDSNGSIDSNKNLFGSLSLGEKSNNKEELKYVSDTNKNTSTDNRNTTLNKSDIFQDNRESGKFGVIQNNFKELLKKQIEGQKSIMQPNIVRRSTRTKNVLEKESSIVKTILISEEKSNLEENNSNEKKSNSGQFLFTLNGENKSEKSESKNSLKKMQLNGVNEPVKEKKKKKDLKDKDEDNVDKENSFGMKTKKNDKKGKVEQVIVENEIISSSSQKKDLLSNNLNKDISSNTISSIDNNIESVKNMNGSNYHSINKLLLDIGSRRNRRRKSNITNSFYKHKSIYTIGDMVSYSSSQSNILFNNNQDTYHHRRNSNFNLQILRCNSTQNIKNKNNISFLNNNLRFINNEKSNNNSTQNSGALDSLSLINKLKNLNLSLENERANLNLLKNIKISKKKLDSINNDKNANNKGNINFILSKTPKVGRIQSRNFEKKKKYKSKVSSYDVNTASTKSTVGTFNYPDVYYINGENNLHKKIHISSLFSKLKAVQNNNMYE